MLRINARDYFQAFGDPAEKEEWIKLDKWALGKYKRKLVAVKKLRPTNFKLTRDVRKELQQVGAF